MTSIAKDASVFDGMVRESKESAVGWVAANAERIDSAIYSMVDHGRFTVASRRPRTVMTTAGPVRYLRRCYYDSFGERYVCPLDSLLGIPPSAVAGALRSVVEMGDLSSLRKANALDHARLCQSDPGCFDAWDDEGYAGSPQGG